MKSLSTIFRTVFPNEEVELPTKISSIGSDRNRNSQYFWVPGRIELIGKHTDYCGGPSLTCATEHGILSMCTRSFPEQDTDIAMSDLKCELNVISGGEELRLDVTKDGIYPDTRTASAPPQWALYPLAVAKRMLSDFSKVMRDDVKACSIAISLWSNLPFAAGLSSSSALVISVAHCLAWAWKLDKTEIWEYNDLNDLAVRASYFSCLENGKDFCMIGGTTATCDAVRGVGTQGGSEDHAAILLSQQNKVSMYTYVPSISQISCSPWFSSVQIVVISSGVLAEKTGSAMRKYNNLSNLASHVVQKWNSLSVSSNSSTIRIPEMIYCSSSGRCSLLADVMAETSSVSSLLGILEKDEKDRVLHFLLECESVRNGMEFVRDGDLRGFARVVNSSRANAEKYLHNSVDETVFLCHLGVILGCLATSPFGAGFGGAVYGIVQSRNGVDDGQKLADEWLERYLIKYPEHKIRAKSMVLRPGMSACRL